MLAGTLPLRHGSLPAGDMVEGYREGEDIQYVEVCERRVDVGQTCAEEAHSRYATMCKPFSCTASLFQPGL